MPSTLRTKSKPVEPESVNKYEKPIEQITEKISDNTQPNKKDLPSSLKPKSLKQKNQDFPFEGENDLDREIERNIARGTSRIGETVLGLPGDLYSFAKSLFGANPETNLPTSKSLKNLSEKATLGYTKAKNEGEEKSDEVLQDIASFLIPGAGKYNLVRNIGIPVVSNLVKEGIKYTGNEKIAEAAKIGTMVVLDLMNLRSGGAKKFAGNLFNESEKLVPQGATLKSNNLQKGLSSLEKSLESGGSAPSTEKALKKVNEIQSKMKSGEIEIKELIDFRKNINEIKYELGGYEVQLPKAIKKKAIANLDHVKSEVIKALDEYGAVKNPEFLKLNKSANEAYAAYESSDKWGKFIKQVANKAIKNNSLKLLLGLGGTYAFPAIAAKTAGAAIPVKGAYEAYKILHQVSKSPTLRKFYGNILKGAAAGNASQVLKNAKALEKEIEKED